MVNEMHLQCFTNAFHLRRFFFFFFFANQMHLFYCINVFDLTNVFTKTNAFILFSNAFHLTNAFVLCTNAFATEAYHFKADVLAVFISRAATVPMFS